MAKSEKGGQTGRREEIGGDVSNSKRRAVFPWQLGSHGNGRAKDAISVCAKKKYIYLHSVALYMCTNIAAQKVSAGICVHGVGGLTHMSTITVNNTPEVDYDSSMTGCCCAHSILLLVGWSPLGKTSDNRAANHKSCARSSDFTDQNFPAGAEEGGRISPHIRSSMMTSFSLGPLPSTRAWQ